MKRIPLFLPLVILLASCAQIPAVPTVTASFTATPTQLPTATTTPVPPTEIPATPTEVIPASPFIELTNKETGEMAIPRDEVVYTPVTWEQVRKQVRKLESEESWLQSETEVMITITNSYGAQGTYIGVEGNLRDAVVIRHAISIEMRSLVDGVPQRSIVVVSELNQWGMTPGAFLDAFYYSAGIRVSFTFQLDLPASNAFADIPGAEYLVDFIGGAQSPTRDKIAETSEVSVHSTDDLILKLNYLWVR